MGLFSNDRGLPSWYDEAPERVNFDSVLEWLTGLSDDDYSKVCKVSAIHRKAQQEAAEALGTVNEITAFIASPLTRHSFDVASEENLLEDENEFTGSILDDDAESEASRKQRKTAEKAVKPV